MTMEFIWLISHIFEYNLLQSIVNGKIVTEETIKANDVRNGVIAIIYLIIYFISGVIFIQWFRRAYYNLHQIVKHLSFSEGWAAGSWFVPILNLFRPFQIMKELFEETKKILTKKGINFDENFSINILDLWWGLWIIDTIIGQIIFHYPSKTIDDLLESNMLNLASNVIVIILGFITVKIIKAYSNLEPLLYEINDNEDSEETKTEKQDIKQLEKPY